MEPSEQTKRVEAAIARDKAKEEEVSLAILATCSNINRLVRAWERAANAVEQAAFSAHAASRRQ